MRRVAWAVCVLASVLPGPGRAEAGDTSLKMVRISTSAKIRTIADLQNRGGTIIDSLDNVPYALVADLTTRELAEIPGVTSIGLPVTVSVDLDSALASIHAAGEDLDVFTAGSGANGAGTAIAIIDDGIDRLHPFFFDDMGSSRVVAEACFLLTFGCTSDSHSATGEGSAAPIGDHDHGTHVAGIAAGNGASLDGAPRRGVAPEADLVAVNVFETDNAYSFDVDRALDWLIGQVDDGLDLRSVNLSLGGGATSTDCDTDPDFLSTKSLVDELNDRGVIVVVASGNESLTSEISYPACLSNVIPIGSSDDSGVVSSFSNISVAVAERGFLAPGENITSSKPSTDGGETFGYQTLSGTSMATPMVAGAIAALASTSPASTRADILDALRTTGTLVDDTRDGGSVTAMRRIDVAAAVIHIIGSTLSGTIIDRDLATPVATTDVTLTFDPGDGNTDLAFAEDITTGDDGAFSIEGLPTGSWNVSADAFGWSTTEPVPVSLASNSETTVELQATAVIDIDSISPSSGPTAGGTLVTITGIHLSTATTVTFGGNEGTTLSVDEANDELTVVTPAGNAGVVDVVVSDDVRSSRQSVTFTYVARRTSSGGGGGGGGGAPSPRTAEGYKTSSTTVVASQSFTFGFVDVTFTGSSPTPGTVTVTPKTGRPRIAAGGLLLPGYWLDITSTVTSYATVEVCAPYEPSRLASYRITEDQLRLFHWDGSIRTDVTTRVDTIKKQVCGTTNGLSPFAVGKLQTTRVAGGDRYETAVKISQRQFPGTSSVVYLVTGEKFPDALAAGVAAVRDNAPVLLSYSSTLPPATREELVRLQPERIVVVGGPAAINAAVENQIIDAVPTATIERVAGRDRYDTAVLLSKRSTVVPGGRVYFGSGESFVESLAVAAMAAGEHATLLLVPRPGNFVPAGTVQEVARLAPQHIVVAGNASVVSDAAVAVVAAASPSSEVRRIAGETSIESAARATSDFIAGGTVFVATDRAFADGLAGGAWAGRESAPIVIVPSAGALPTSVANALSMLAPTRIVIFGGPAAVSTDVENSLAQFLPG